MQVLCELRKIKALSDFRFLTFALHKLVRLEPDLRFKGQFQDKQIALEKAKKGFRLPDTVEILSLSFLIMKWFGLFLGHLSHSTLHVREHR